MTVRVAIIGAGIMGSDHARILSSDVSGAKLQVICDANKDRARSVGDAHGAVDIATEPLDVIGRSDVDAVLIASPDDTHADLVIAAIEAGKPVLCEKPLAPETVDCLRVIEAEVARGRRLVTVGFMRRFDPHYAEMKSGFASGTIGNALMMHNFHRNVAAPDWFTGQMAISNSAPHEFDIARYVLGTEFASITAFQGKSEGAIAPVMMVLETSERQIVNIEINNNAAYGYEVRAELVGQTGSIDLTTPTHSSVNIALSAATNYAQDWRPRFAEAYRLQNKAWLEGVKSGEPSKKASNVWDGYCATAIAEAGVLSLTSGRRAAIDIIEAPALYKQKG